MKEEESSKCVYIRSTADILLKWKDMRSIADIPKLYQFSCGYCHKETPVSGFATFRLAS